MAEDEARAGAIDGTALVSGTVTFARELRAAGLAGDLQAAIDFGRALTHVDIADRAQVHAAGATLFVRQRAELPIYDDVFERFWGRPGQAFQEALIGRTGSRRAAAASDGYEKGASGTAIAPRRAYSATETFRRRAFDRMTAEELRDAERLIEQLAARVAARRSRRLELDSHGRRLAPRPMLRRSLSTGGEALQWLWRRPAKRPRRLVVLCDISGSMELHARLLLRFVHALGRAPQPVEAFVFGTQLTRISRLLRDADVDRCLQRVTAVVQDWAGGTRIGSSFRSFNLHWARRVLPSSGDVLVLSDGWDRGEPELVRSETERLQRSCHRLVWLNPLAAAPGYEPVARGMAAALPFVDVFLPAANLANLEQLGVVLAEKMGPHQVA